MGSIYETIILRENTGNFERITRVEYLRSLSDIAKQETDEEIQEFFTAFHI